MKFYLRFPISTDEEGTNARILSESDGEIKIEEKTYDIVDQTGVVKLTNDQVNINSSVDHIIVTIPKTKKDQIAWFWLSQTQYKPSDTIKGFLVVRERITASSSMLKRISKKGILTFGKKNARPIQSKEIDFENVVTKFEFIVPPTTLEGDYVIELKDEEKILLQTIECPIFHYEKKKMDVEIILQKWAFKHDEVPLEVRTFTYGGEPLKKEVIVEYDDEKIVKHTEKGIAHFLIYPHSEKITIWIDGKEFSKNLSISEKGIDIRMFTPSKMYSQVLLDFDVTLEDPSRVPYSSIPVFSRWTRINKLGQKIQYQEHLKTSDREGKCTFQTEFDVDGMYEWEVGCEVDGIEHTAIRKIHVKRSLENFIQINHTLEKKKYIEGEEIKGSVKIKGDPASCKKISHCFVDLVTDRITETKKIELVNGKGKYVFNGVTDFYGTFAIDSYFRPSSFGIGNNYEVEKDTIGCIIEREIGSISPPIPFKCDMIVNHPSSVSTGEKVTIEVKIDGELIDEYFTVFGVLIDQRVLHHHRNTNLCETFLKKPEAMEVKVAKSEMMFLPKAKEMLLGSSSIDELGWSISNRRYRSTSYRPIVHNAFGRSSSTYNRTPPPPPSRPPSFSAGPISFNKTNITEVSSFISNILTTIRKNFAESLLIDPIHVKDNTCTIEFEAPDGISKYSLFMFGIGETQFAESESEIKVRNPLYMELHNPSRIVVEDKVMIPIAIQNKTDSDLHGRLDVLSCENIEVVRIDSEEFTIPQGSLKKYVYIKGSKVGFGQIQLKLTTDRYIDIIGFDQSLYIKPPNDPIIEDSSVLLSKDYVSHTIEIPEHDSVYSLLSMSIIPRSPIASLEGLDRLMEYPYGCCEQTVAKTIPNARIYQYLESQNKLTQPIKEKLITNMEGGVQLLMKYNNSDGGFSYWGKESKVFYTALALSALGKVSQYVSVKKSALENALQYLQSKKDGEKWSVDSHNAKESIPIRSIYSMNAYILYSLTEAGLWDESSYQWMVENVSNYENDAILLGIMLYISSVNKKGNLHFFFEKLKNTCVKDDNEIYWVSESAMVGSQKYPVEASAYAILGISHAFPKEVELIDKTLHTVLSQKTLSTRDSLMVINAMLCGSTEKINCTISLFHNKNKVKEVSVNETNVWWKAFNLSQTDFEISIGDAIEIVMEGEGVWNVHSEFKKWSFNEKESEEIAQKITYNKRERNGTIDISLQPKSSYNGVLIEQNIPSNCTIDLDRLDELKKSVNRVMVANEKITLHIDSLDDVKTLHIPILLKRSGECLVEHTKFYEMYNPIPSYSLSGKVSNM